MILLSAASEFSSPSSSGIPCPSSLLYPAQEHRSRRGIVKNKFFFIKKEARGAVSKISLPPLMGKPADSITGAACGQLDKGWVLGKVSEEAGHWAASPQAL